MQRCIYSLLVSFLLSTFMLMTGCIPLSNPAPFPEESLSKLSSADANRQLVRAMFGEPTTVKNAGEYWFYGEIREVMAVVLAGGVAEDYEWLVVQFDDNDQVIFYEFNDTAHGCTSNGICALYGVVFPVSKRDKAVITAPATKDIITKSYQVTDEECAIYLYQKPFFSVIQKIFRSANYPVSFFVDDHVVGTINHESYLFLTHSPGRLSIKAYQFVSDIKCQAGEKIYIRADEGGLVEKGKNLTTAPTELGEAAIAKRRLALSN